MLRTKVSLKSFFIFNPTFCEKEGEEDRKVLFYYPETVDNNEKLRDVGFIEAIVKFTSTFSSKKDSTDVMNMRNLKTLKFFFEPEKDFWIVLTINVPFERKEKDKKEFFEYYCDDVHDEVFEKVIQRAYRHFKMFNNSIESNITGETIDEKLQSIRGKLDNFFTKYLLTMNVQNADIIDCIECTQYKPITHLIFFRIVNFMNMVTSIKTLHIKKCIFYFNNQEVVYSSLSPSDLYVLNEFLNVTVFPKYLQRRNSQSFDTDRTTGCFVMEHDTDTISNAPRIFLLRDGSKNVFDVYRVIIYSVLDVSLVMLIEDIEGILGDEFCNEIKYSIGPQLSLISKDISDNSLHFQQQNAAKNQTPIDEALQEKYIYFNHKNHRVHACFYESDAATRGRKTQLSTSVMNLLCDLYESTEDESDQLISSETEKIIKTYNDYWIIAKTYNSRSIYLILHKSSTLIDIAEEAQRMLSEIVKNVYFTNQQ